MLRLELRTGHHPGRHAQLPILSSSPFVLGRYRGSVCTGGWRITIVPRNGLINGFVSGHDFSRAAKSRKNRWALAPEGLLLRCRTIHETASSPFVPQSLSLSARGL